MDKVLAGACCDGPTMKEAEWQLCGELVLEDDDKGFPRAVDDKRKRISPHAEKNKAAILEIIRKHLVTRGTSVLEVGSGTGQHVAFLAKEMPKVSWQPSEWAGHQSPHFEANDVVDALRSIDAWCEDLANVKPAVALDCAANDWGLAGHPPFHAILAVDVIQICSPQARRGIFAGADRVLNKSRGLVFLYAPYIVDDHTAENNRALDAILKSKEVPGWGIQNVDDTDALATSFGFDRIALEQMPADHICLVYAKCAH